MGNARRRSESFDTAVMPRHGLPVVQIDTVFHAGTLNPAHKRRWSLEGRCLSVSLCPHAWRAVARLGGAPLHQLHLAGAEYIDGYALLRRDGQLLQDWGVRNDLAMRATVYRAWRFDDESDEWGYMDCSTEEEARWETCADAGPGGRPAVEAVSSVVGLPRLNEWMGRTPSAQSVSGDLVYFLAESLASQSSRLVGVVWREAYDPPNLSAPRGAIMPGSVARFATSQVSWSHAADRRGFPAFSTAETPLPWDLPLTTEIAPR